nr:DDB1- and CUL4-associated factor 13 [Tanacetum cinerariifolium]
MDHQCKGDLFATGGAAQVDTWNHNRPQPVTLLSGEVVQFIVILGNQISWQYMAMILLAHAKSGMAYMNKNYGTLPVTAEQLLVSKRHKQKKQYLKSSDVTYIMLLVYVYAVFAGCFLNNIYRDAKVNPLRSIRVRVLEASYYLGILLMPLFSVLGQFPHTKHVEVWCVRSGIAMLIAALIFIFNGFGMTYMNKNYGTLPVTAEQLLDIKMAQAEETVPERQYKFSVIKLILVMLTPIFSMFLMVIFETELSDANYIMILVYVYAVFAGYFLNNIYLDAKVNPLRSIRVRALEASYYLGEAAQVDTWNHNRPQPVNTFEWRSGLVCCNLREPNILAAYGNDMGITNYGLRLKDKAIKKLKERTQMSKKQPSDVIYIMLLVYVYAVFAGCFLNNIYLDAKVNPLRSIRVRALEASYYLGLLIMALFSVLGQFPHTKHVVVWCVRSGIAMLAAALIFIFNGCGIRVLRPYDAKRSVGFELLIRGIGWREPITPPTP